MKVSYKWLSELVDLSGIDAYQAADALTNTGLEVEEVQALASATNLVIGQVIACEEHPDSDHLHVTKVDVGTEILDVVCGAKNCRKGLKVIVAKVGAKLPEIEIKAAKVRGVASNGMLCSLMELGVAKKHLSEKSLAGIEELAQDAPVGSENVLEYLGLDDYILDVKPTPNRQDLLSVYGIAHELAAVFKRELKIPSTKEIEREVENDIQLFRQEDVCDLFLATKVSGVVVKESPLFIKQRLVSSGISSINNIVDISNYVMLELGQPLHFYDTSKIAKDIRVKTGYEGDFNALDGNVYSLKKQDIVIQSGDNVVGIAGVMGGETSKIDEQTTELLIEAARFKGSAVRNTSRRLNLLTDASVRFAKGIEDLNPIKATKRAVELLVEYADAKVVSETTVSGSINNRRTTVEVMLEYINQLLGTDYSEQEVFDVLASLSFKPTVENGLFHVQVPSFRQDIQIAQDIVEEVIRLLGFSRLKTSLSDGLKTIGKLSEQQRLTRNTKDILNSFGLDEIITYTLIDEKLKEDELFVQQQAYQLLSPMSEKRRYIRESLMGSMLECVAYNKARKVERVNVFEISSFSNQVGHYRRLGIYLDQEYQTQKLKGVTIKGDFYTLKGMLLSYLTRIGIGRNRVQIVENDFDHQHFYPYKSAKVLIDKKFFGIFGHLHPTVLKKYSLMDSVYGEFSLDVIENTAKEKVKFKSLDRFPSSSRDIALVVDEQVAVGEILKQIKASSKLVKELEVFDVYQGEHVEKGKKSVAINIVYNGVDHTLSEEELNIAHSKIMDTLYQKLQAEIRR